MIDIHCHLLPGIDDGPATLGESLTLCRLAVADGITHAVVTPHIHPGRWENDCKLIQERLALLRSALAREHVHLQLGFAAEVRLTDRLFQQIAEDSIPFYGELGGYSIMLLEFPHGHIVPGSDKLVAWLLERKIRPLIAHPERNRQVMKAPELLQPFLEAGCWLQLTAGSIVGDFGQRAGSVARTLLDNGAVKVVASDGHNAGPRPPCMRAAFDYISRHFSPDYARRLMLEAPAAITAGQFGH